MLSHETLLKAYIFDYLKKTGFVDTCHNFVEECKDLPIINTAKDSSRANAFIPNISNTHKTPRSSPAETSTAKDSTEGSKKPSSSAAGTPESDTCHHLPSVNVPFDIPNGFLLQWWCIFWDVYAANLERPKFGAVSERVRAYVQQQQKLKAGKGAANRAMLNANGKRAASSQDTTEVDPTNPSFTAPIIDADALNPAKHLRINRDGECSPQSAALIEMFSMPSDDDTVRIYDSNQQHQNQAGGARPATQEPAPAPAAAAAPMATRGNSSISEFTRGLGVNISPSGGHTISEEYTGFLSNSLKIVAESQASLGNATANDPAAKESNLNGARIESSNNATGAKPKRISRNNSRIGTNSTSISASPPSQTGPVRHNLSTVMAAAAELTAEARDSGSMQVDSAQRQSQHIQSQGVSRLAQKTPVYTSPQICSGTIPHIVPTHRANSQHISSPITAGSMVAPGTHLFQAVQQRLISPPPPSALPMASPTVAHRGVLNDVRHKTMGSPQHSVHNPNALQQRVGSANFQQHQKQQMPPPPMPDTIPNQTVPPNYGSSNTNMAPGLITLSPGSFATAVLNAGITHGQSMIVSPSSMQSRMQQYQQQISGNHEHASQDPQQQHQSIQQQLMNQQQMQQYIAMSNMQGVDKMDGAQPHVSGDSSHPQINPHSIVSTPVSGRGAGGFQATVPLQIAASEQNRYVQWQHQHQQQQQHKTQQLHQKQQRQQQQQHV
ncbi:hypothetical protein LPJ66_007026, partial [Kickxella alabastrina]